MHWSSSWHPRGLDPRNPMGAVTILQPHLRVFKLERITDAAATLGLQPSAGQRGAIAGAPRSIMGASALSFALVTSECMSRVPASGRADGSLTSAAATKEASTSPHSGDSEGGGPLTMANMMSNTDESSEFGGFIVASSMAVMPTPHTSTLLSYVETSMAVTEPKASGAIQCGVPIIVPRICIVLYTCAATPRSPSLTLPVRVRRTLAALTSRWSARSSLCM
mmetsp:Transcript_5850/g.18328  ORF Transcript_5850/g.18328 Transcript_5850/m.18328 type:complete len:222 (-) Transcript_5850:3150-3815(-)